MKGAAHAALLAIVTLAAPAWAAPCVPGTLLDYLTTYASSTCEVDNAGLTLTFGDFRLASLLPAGQDPIAAADVSVSPLSGPTGLSFSPGTLVASAPNQYGIRFGFSVGAPALDGSALELIGVNATGDGNVTAIQWVCLGDAFAGDPGDGGSCPATELLQIAYASALVVDGPQSFVADPPLGFFDIFVELTVDGGPSAGSAALSAVTTTFSGSGRTTVPEPSVLMLAGIALAAIAGLRRRTAH